MHMSVCQRSIESVNVKTALLTLLLQILSYYTHEHAINCGSAVVLVFIVFTSIQRINTFYSFVHTEK